MGAGQEAAALALRRVWEASRRVKPGLLVLNTSRWVRGFGFRGGERAKREKPCKASGNRGNAGVCTRRESGLTKRSQNKRLLPGVGWGGCGASAAPRCWL